MLSIFFGYIFVMFHINLYELDMLPDFVGYIFMISGLDGMVKESPNFKKARNLSMIMLVFTFLHSCLKFMQLTLGTSDSFNNVSMFILSLAAILTFLGISWNIAMGVNDMELSRGKNLGAKGLKIIVELMALSTVIVKILMGIPSEFTHVTGEVLYLITMATNVIFLRQFYRTKRILEKHIPGKKNKYEIIYTDDKKQH